MPVNLLPEDQLRAALRPYRVDPETFETAVRARLQSSPSRHADLVASLSPALRSAAALLPLQVIGGDQTTGAALRLAPVAGVYKLLGYAAFPAISLFVLLGATVFSFLKIRKLRDENRAAPIDQQMLQASTQQWWHDHKWGALVVYASTLAMAWIGATWLIFLFYIVSLALLGYVLTSFGRIGLGNRLVVGQSCLLGLTLLGQVAGFSGIGDQSIHLVDQVVLVPLFFCGALALLLVIVFSTARDSAMGSSAGGGLPRNRPVQGGLAVPLAVATAPFAAIVVALTAWMMSPLIWPATDARIKAYVESFDSAPFSSASWHQWEIVASWAVDSKLDPNLSAPRQLLAKEIDGEQNPFILGTAFRVGLVQADQLSRLKDYEKQRHYLLDDPTHTKEAQQITSLEQEDWVIRAAVLHNDLTREERDYLEKRLHVTLAAAFAGRHADLKTPLRATQLLKVIERPVDPVLYRDRVHELLRQFHSTNGGGFQVAGGFKDYSNIVTGSLDATSCGVELMEFYGIPDDLDLDWVRSYLKPQRRRVSPEKWIAAVTLDRLNCLPGVTHPTWWKTLYYERSLLAAVVLIGLCIYATLCSPMPRAVATTDGSSQAEPAPGGGPV